MTQTVTTLPERGRPSGLLAAEIRAEMGRQGLNQSALARRMHVGQAWLSRRIGVNADVDLTLEETVAMAEALNVTVQGLYAAVLPRLDSNQQPSGYQQAQVIDLDVWRAARGCSCPRTADQPHHPSCPARAAS